MFIRQVFFFSLFESSLLALSSNLYTIYNIFKDSLLLFLTVCLCVYVYECAGVHVYDMCTCVQVPSEARGLRFPLKLKFQGCVSYLPSIGAAIV